MTDLMNNIKNLRDLTGAGFLDCKKALEENNNDVEISIDFLRKKGLANASKKSSREAKEGAVGIYTNENFTSIIKINTETDFAAKNDVFLNFMDEIGTYSLQPKISNLSVDEFNKMSFKDRLIEDRFKDIISKIGENIILSKLNIIEKKDGEMISSYIHNGYRTNIGKIGVILKTTVNEVNDAANILGKNLCMHIAASKPLALDIENLDSGLVSKEKIIQLETIKSSGKPDNIIDKILEGKMKKFYSESTLLHQSYILDPDKTVESTLLNFSKNNEIKIIDYNLFALGS